MIRLRYTYDIALFPLIAVISLLNILILKSSLFENLYLKFATNLGFGFLTCGNQWFTQLFLSFIDIILKVQSLKIILEYYHILAYIQNYSNS